MLAKHLSLLISFSLPLMAADWPQWLGPERDGIWREEGILEEFPEGGPEILWRVPVGAGYSGPAVANGRVFLTDRQLRKDASIPGNPFARGEIPGVERVLCLDEKTGRELWKHEYDSTYTISYAAGPRATPLVDGDRLYTLGAEGDLKCFDVATGKIIWELDFNERYKIPTPLWGFSAHPLVDGDKLICLVGGNGTTAVAFNKHNGQEIWRALSAKEPGYCPPMIYRAQGKRQLIIWHPEAVNGLNPDTGELYWSEPLEVQSALSVPTPRMWGNDHLYLTAFYNGSRMFRFNQDQPGVTLVWRSKKNSEKDTSSLHSIISTPYLEDDHIYGVCSYGQLRCIDAATGERIWESMKATTVDEQPARWANAFIVRHGSRYFLANEKGELIIANLAPQGYHEISRAKILEPTNKAAGRDVVWSHPAFANGAVLMRNDHELVRASLKALD